MRVLNNLIVVVLFGKSSDYIVLYIIRSTIITLIQGRTVALKVKTVHFEVKTRAVTLPQPVSSEDQLYGAASELLTAEIRACAPNPLRLRLMGESPAHDTELKQPLSCPLPCTCMHEKKGKSACMP